MPFFTYKGELLANMAAFKEHAAFGFWSRQGLATGKEVTMPSAYDEFSDRAFPDYKGGSTPSRMLRDLLRSAMEAQGFTVLKEEWWHFDYKDWRQYRILDVPFEAIQQ